MSKPIIRHCKNCEWCKQNKHNDNIDCTVTYKYILEDFQRIKAILCRYYKQKEGAKWVD